MPNIDRPHTTHYGSCPEAPVGCGCEGNKPKPPADLQPLLAEVAALVLAQKVEFEMQSGKVMITKTKPDPRFAALVEVLTEQHAYSCAECVTPHSECGRSHGTGRRVRDVSAWPEGALAGAIGNALLQIGDYLIKYPGKDGLKIWFALKPIIDVARHFYDKPILLALKAALEKKT